MNAVIGSRRRYIEFFIVARGVRFGMRFQLSLLRKKICCCVLRAYSVALVAGGTSKIFLVRWQREKVVLLGDPSVNYKLSLKPFSVKCALSRDLCL